MLIIPGYVEVLDNGKEVILKSHLHGNIIELTERRYIEELKEIQRNGVKNDNTDLVNFLCEQEMLATKEEIYENIDLLYAMLDKHLQITIMPTEKCNFKCVYCYEDFRNGKMEENLINKIKHFINEKISTGDFESLYVNWFGGEPTLCEEIILDLNDYAKKICDKYNVKFDSSMTTNGYLLSADKLKSFYNVSISVYQITIDGFRHDESRPLLDGRKTLKKLLENLREIEKLSQKLKFKIIVRYNILEKNEDLSWYDLLKEVFNNDERFSILIRVVSDFGGEKVKELNILDQYSYKEVLREHINYARNIGLIVENDSIVNPFASICYAALKNSYIFRSNGRVVKCTLMLDEDRNFIGSAKNRIAIDEAKNERWYDSKIEDKCLQCRYILACLNKNCPKNESNEECIKWVV